MLISPPHLLRIAIHIALYLLLVRYLKRIDANVNEMLWKA